MKNLESQFNTNIDKLGEKLMKNYELGAFEMPKIIQIYRISSPFNS